MSQTPKMGQQLGHITVARRIGHGPGQQTKKTFASLSHPILSLQPLPDTVDGHSSTSRGHFCVKNEPNTQKWDNNLATLQWQGALGMGKASKTRPLHPCHIPY